MITKLLDARVNAIVNGAGPFDRAIAAGASPELALKCSAKADGSHGQRRTFKQAKPDTTSDAQSRQRKLLNKAANRVDLAFKVRDAQIAASNNPTGYNRRKLAKLLLLQSKVRAHAK